VGAGAAELRLLVRVVPFFEIHPKRGAPPPRARGINYHPSVGRLLAMIAMLAGASACRIDFDLLRDDSALAGDDGAVVDDGSGDASIDICASALVCDSYDSALGTVSTFGNIAWGADAGRGGSGGARARGTGPQPALGIYRWASPITSGVLHARAYVNVTAGASIQQYAVLVQVDNDQNTLGMEKVSADLASADRWALAAPFTGMSNVSPTAPPRGTWLCVELAIDISSTTGAARIHADGIEVARIGPANTVVPDGYSRLIIGMSLGSNDPETEAFFDDVIVAQQPIGC
jgi:hypothetical protein